MIFPYYNLDLLGLGKYSDTQRIHEPQLPQKTTVVLLELNFWNAAKYLKRKFNFRLVWRQEGRIAVKTHGKSKRQIVASLIPQ